MLRYLKGTVHYVIRYARDDELLLRGFVDSDWIGDASVAKSTSSFHFSVSIGMISWFSRKQFVVALSSAKAEYTVASSSSCDS